MCSCPRRALWLTNIDAVFDLCLRGRVCWNECTRKPSFLIWIKRREEHDWDVEAQDNVWFQHECHRFLEGDKEHMSVCLLVSYYRFLSFILRIHLSKCMCVRVCVCACVHVCVRVCLCVCVCQYNAHASASSNRRLQPVLTSLSSDCLTCFQCFCDVTNVAWVCVTRWRSVARGETISANRWLFLTAGFGRTKTITSASE